MSEDKLPSRRKTLLYAIVPLAFLVIGITEMLVVIALHRSNSEVDARVVDSRVMSTRYGLSYSYELKYVFQPALNARSIGRTGFFHDNLWSSLPEAEWKKAVQTGFVSVKFDPLNPGSNAPLVELPSLLDSSVPIGLGLFLSFCIVVIEVKRRKLLTAPSAMG